MNRMSERWRLVVVAFFALAVLFACTITVAGIIIDLHTTHRLSPERWFSIVFLPLAILIFVRSELVYRYRTWLLDQVSAAAQNDIELGHYSLWPRRYDTLKSVSYGRMAVEFWKPLGAFYSPTQKRTMTEPHVTHL